MLMVVTHKIMNKMNSIFPHHYVYQVQPWHRKNNVFLIGIRSGLSMTVFPAAITRISTRCNLDAKSFCLGFGIEDLKTKSYTRHRSLSICHY